MSAPAAILIVDDERANRHLLPVLLKPKGYATRAAANGEEALASIAAAPPALILLDVMMPGIDGRAVASAVKADPATSNIPIIIMVTAQSDKEASGGPGSRGRGLPDKARRPDRTVAARAQPPAAQDAQRPTRASPGDP